MSFKHTKFEDSTTMRSLVKVAKEKGWVKDEPLQKTASAPKIDLTPSDNFTENLLKLCEGLRSSGFEKQAEELESNFVQYKRANALYEVGGEKGEDLVHAAHPKGSHKLEDVDSKEATFEDILDKHLQMLNVVEKKPTGKLASSNDILKAVKTVLSQAKPEVAAPSLGELYEQANTAFQKFKQVYSNIALQVGEDASTNRDYFDMLQRAIDDRKVYSSRGLENSLVDAIDNMKSDKEPGWFSAADETQKWQDVVLPMIEIANRFANQFRSAVGQIRKMETVNRTQDVTRKYDPDAVAVAKEPVSVSPQETRLTALVTKLNGYKLISSVAKNQAASKWINDEIAEINQILANVKKPEAQEVMPALEKEIAEKESEVNQFVQSWAGKA